MRELEQRRYERTCKAIASINLYQWLCFFPVAIFLTTKRIMKDAQYEPAVTTFHMICIAVGIVVFIVMQLMKAHYREELRAMEAAHPNLEGKL